MTTTEQREHPRYAVALNCEIDAGGRTVTAKSRDLSRGGIALSAGEPLDLSTEVELSIALVFGDASSSEPLRVKAVIMWCTRLGEQWQLGAKFVQVTRETRGYLDVFLRFLEGPPDDGPDEEPEPSPRSSRRRP